MPQLHELMRALATLDGTQQQVTQLRANPTKVMAGRTSAGQLPRFSSAWPSSSSRMTASCSAPVMRRISSSEIVRSSAKAKECTEHHRCLRRVIFPRCQLAPQDRTRFLRRGDHQDPRGVSAGTQLVQDNVDKQARDTGTRRTRHTPSACFRQRKIPGTRAALGSTRTRRT